MGKIVIVHRKCHENSFRLESTKLVEIPTDKARKELEKPITLLTELKTGLRG